MPRDEDRRVGARLVPRLSTARTGPPEVATFCCHEFGAFSVVFSADGSRLLTSGEDAAARVWLISEAGSTGPVVELLGHGAGLTDEKFSPDGSRIATASADGTVRLWDSTDGSELLRLATGAANSVEFSIDGSHLLVATGSGAVLIVAPDVKELVELAHDRLTRWWTTDECPRYLHTEVCPPKP